VTSVTDTASAEPALESVDSVGPAPLDARVDRCKLGPLGLAVYNALYWPYLLVSCAVLFFPALALRLFSFTDPKRRLLSRYTSVWGAHYLSKAPFASVRVEGLEHAPRDGAAVYVVNHQSMVDILAVFATRLPYLWVSKVENFYAPFLGWNMWLNGYVPLKRGHLPSIVRMVRRCLRELGHGHSLCVFPEGTRSPDGNLIAFQRGAFWLAARAGVPVVPVVVDGTGSILRKKSLQIRPQETTVRLLAPLRASDVACDARQLSALVRQRMAAALRELRQTAASPSK
jgi:1-acyl-sn-glycerol-3-phosphate acyltransferase